MEQTQNLILTVLNKELWEQYLDEKDIISIEGTKTIVKNNELVFILNENRYESTRKLYPV